MTDRYPASEFDAWADSYDESVTHTNEFPFVGYPQVLDTIVTGAQPRAGMRVLDLGTGTGLLAAPFAGLGCEVWATDYSTRMLEHARRRLPGARLVWADLRQAWPEEIDGRFDAIVSAYVFHHFDLAHKVAICQDLVQQRLYPAAALWIGDIAFANPGVLHSTRRELGDAWDEEDYWIVERDLPALRAAGLHADFIPISYCAGVFRVQADMR